MDEKKRIAFIVNPISGVLDKHQIMEGMAPEAGQGGLRGSCRVYRAGRPCRGDCRPRGLPEGTYAVVAVGGDGTINEIARSLVHTSTALGIIPCGSGNGLARHLQIPLDPRRAIGILNEGHVETIDYGTLNGTPFFCTCGVGFGRFCQPPVLQGWAQGDL